MELKYQLKQGLMYLFEALSQKLLSLIILLQPYVGRIRMKICNPNNCSQPIVQYISHSYEK